MAHPQIVTFSFTGAAGNETSFAPDSQPAGATASDFTRGSGLTPSSTAGTFNSSGWTTSTTLDLNDYYSFSLTPAESYRMSLTSVALDERRSSTGIRNWSVRSSMDNFSSDLSFFSVPDDTAVRSGQSTLLGSAFESLASGVEFRFYGFGAESGSGTWRFDNVQVSGSLTAVPEPHQYATAACLGVLIFAAGRRYWQRKCLQAKIP